MKEGKAKNVNNILQFTWQQHIEQPKQLTMDKLRDGLQLAHICKADLQKQAKGLCKVHLRDYLIDAQTKKQHKRVPAIKQKCNQEESKRMWYLIKQIVKDLHSPSDLRCSRL
jgi:hypothetical protein